MALERRDNDEQMEKLRMEADDVAAKVRVYYISTSNAHSGADGGTSEEERRGA
jgi:hypothetical protein